jgi:hypothetical protein
MNQGGNSFAWLTPFGPEFQNNHTWIGMQELSKVLNGLVIGRMLEDRRSEGSRLLLNATARAPACRFFSIYA